MSKNQEIQKVSLYNRWLNGIEKAGNKLPHPVALFAMLALLVVVISAVCAACPRLASWSPTASWP